MFGIYDYDRVGEARVLKAIQSYRKGGTINRLRARRLYYKNLDRYQINIRPDIVVGENFHIVHAAPLRIGCGVTFGDDVTIGTHAIVTKDVPSHSTVVGTNHIIPKSEEQIPEKYKVK